MGVLDSHFHLQFYIVNSRKISQLSISFSQGIVTKQYLTWKEVWEENCHSKRQQIIDNLPQIRQAYENTSKVIRGTSAANDSQLDFKCFKQFSTNSFRYLFDFYFLEALAECFDPILEKTVLPRLPEVIGIMSDSVRFFFSNCYKKGLKIVVFSMSITVIVWIKKKKML